MTALDRSGVQYPLAGRPGGGPGEAALLNSDLPVDVGREGPPAGCPAALRLGRPPTAGRQGPRQRKKPGGIPARVAQGGRAGSGRPAGAGWARRVVARRAGATGGAYPRRRDGGSAGGRLTAGTAT